MLLSNLYKHKALLKQTGTVKYGNKNKSHLHFPGYDREISVYFPEKVIYFGIQGGEGKERKEESWYSSGFLDQRLLEAIFLMSQFKSQSDLRVKEKVHHLMLSVLALFRRWYSVLSMLLIRKVRKTLLSRLIPIDSPLFGYE